MSVSSVSNWVRVATSPPIVRTRERWIRESPTQPAATPAAIAVRSSTDAHGSALDSRVAMPATR